MNQITKIRAAMPTPADSPYPSGSHGSPDDIRWRAIDLLTVVGRDLNLKSAHIVTLKALLSFLPPDAEVHMVFASNKSICARLGNVPEKTFRRHVERLKEAALLRRDDSPNCKRYVRRNTIGQITRIFGFDLSPLFEKIEELEIRARLKALDAHERASKKEEASLLISALEKRSQALGEDLSEQIAEMRNALRRKSTDTTMIEEILTGLRALLEVDPIDVEQGARAAKMTASDGQIDRHYQKTNKDPLESESTQPVDDRPGGEVGMCIENGASPEVETETDMPGLAETKARCEGAMTMAPEPIDSWHQMAAFGAFLAPQLGIGPDVWRDAARQMGPARAAVAVLCMTETFGRISNPGGYLRSLAARFTRGEFSARRMLDWTGRKASMAGPA